MSAFLVDPNKIPIDVEGIMMGGGSTEGDKPVGVLKVNIFEAKNLKNIEKVGKSDPYVRIWVGGKVAARTKTMEEK